MDPRLSPAPISTPSPRSTPRELPPRPLRKTLSAELWANAASHLAPQDFVALTSCCRDFYALRQVRPVLNAVLRHNPLAAVGTPSGGIDPERSAWHEIAGTAGLMGRLQQGPASRRVYGADTDAAAATRLSANRLHVLVEHSLHDRWVGQIYNFSGKRHRPLTFAGASGELEVKFTASGRHLVARTDPTGPIELFDLSDYSKPPRLIAPQVSYRYSETFSNDHGVSFVVGCSDRSIRTFTFNNDSDCFAQTAVFAVHHDGTLMDVSDNQRVFLLAAEDRAHVYYLAADSKMKWIGEVDDPCCGGVWLSPHGRFVSGHSGCSSCDFDYGIDFKKPASNAFYQLDGRYQRRSNPGQEISSVGGDEDATAAAQCVPNMQSQNSEEADEIESDRQWLLNRFKLMPRAIDVQASVANGWVNLELKVDSSHLS